MRELPAPLHVVKKDGRREAFDRDKLIAGLKKACEKRPVSVDQLEAFVTELERRLQELGEKEVTSTTLGEMIMERLPTLDEVAYVRFASVYRSFQDVDAFRHEIEHMRTRRRRSTNRDQLSLLPGAVAEAAKDKKP